jgi:hypothetical protein
MPKFIENVEGTLGNLLKESSADSKQFTVKAIHFRESFSSWREPPYKIA